MKKTMILALAVLGMAFDTLAGASSVECTWVESEDFGCNSFDCLSENLNEFVLIEQILKGLLD